MLGGATVTGINFDNAASTPPLSRVRDMVTAFSDLYSSVHRGTGYKSRLSTEAYEQARELVSKFLGVDEKDQVVIFVKGTTDALNRIAAEEARLNGRQVLVTEMEHHADLLPWRHRGDHVMVGLSDEGHIDLEAIEHALKSGDGKISLVAVCGASNVTGFVSPIHEVAELAHRYGARISVDAAQLAPHHRIDVRPADDPGHLDFLSFSGHKMYAPYGAGVLIAPSLLLYPTFMDQVLVFGFTGAVLGGLDSAVGAVVGGLLMGFALSYVGGYLGSDLETVGALVILIAVLMVRPRGLFSRHRLRQA